MKLTALGVAAVAGSMILAACGSTTQSTTTSAARPAVQAQAPAAQAQAPVTAPVTGGVQTFNVLETANTFQPAQIAVQAGARVRLVLRNEDGEEHNVVSTQFTIPQNQQPAGALGTVEFAAPARAGTYEIICAFHTAQGMKMRLVVQ